MKLYIQLQNLNVYKYYIIIIIHIIMKLHVYLAISIQNAKAPLEHLVMKAEKHQRKTRVCCEQK